MRLTPHMIMHAYAQGVFPMAESAGASNVHWVQPRRRGILPLDNFHISRSLSKVIRRCDYQIRTDSDFRGVMEGCADRPETWINPQIFDVFGQLHRMGLAHSLEVWREDRLIGGTYGLAMGQAFFAESMFSRQRNASKIALAWLVHRLRAGGFMLCDTQFLTPHLASLGGQEISAAEYMRRLAAALQGEAVFAPPAYQPSCGIIASSGTSTSGPTSSTGASGVRQRSTQTS